MSDERRTPPRTDADRDVVARTPPPGERTPRQYDRDSTPSDNDENADPTMPADDSSLNTKI